VRRSGRAGIKLLSHDVATSTSWDDPSFGAWDLLRMVAVDNRCIAWPKA
jgi:hypothetical protein